MTAETEQTFEQAGRNWQDGKTKRQHWKTDDDDLYTGMERLGLNVHVIAKH